MTLLGHRIDTTAACLSVKCLYLQHRKLHSPIHRRVTQRPSFLLRLGVSFVPSPPRPLRFFLIALHVLVLYVLPLTLRQVSEERIRVERSHTPLFAESHILSIVRSNVLPTIKISLKIHCRWMPSPLHTTRMRRHLRIQ
jgi:hypothetical protein